MAHGSGGGSREFDLSEFVGEVSELFVVMGVFGALVFYISQTAEGPISEASFMIKTGFVTSFLLSLLVFYLIYSKMRDEFGSWVELYRAHLRPENWDLLLFSVLLFLLVLSVGRVLMLRQPLLFLLVAAATMGSVILGLVWTADFVSRAVPGSLPWRIAALAGAFGAVFAGSVYARSALLAGAELSAAGDASLSAPRPFLENLLILAVVTARSFAGVGLVGAIVSVPLAVLERLGVVSYFGDPD